MKTNEAPEKIYFSQLEDGRQYFTPAIPFEREFVEYIPVDAFIEKACDAYCAICDTKECGGCAECSWVIKFRRQLLKY